MAVQLGVAAREPEGGDRLQESVVVADRLPDEDQEREALQVGLGLSDQEGVPDGLAVVEPLRVSEGLSVRVVLRLRCACRFLF